MTPMVWLGASGGREGITGGRTPPAGHAATDLRPVPFPPPHKALELLSEGHDWEGGKQFWETRPPGNGHEGEQGRPQPHVHKQGLLFPGHPCPGEPSSCPTASSFGACPGSCACCLIPAALRGQSWGSRAWSWPNPPPRTNFPSTRGGGGPGSCGLRATALELV